MVRISRTLAKRMRRWPIMDEPEQRPTPQLPGALLGTGFAANDTASECALLALNALLELNMLLSHRIEDETARVVESTHHLMRQAHDATMGEMIANIAHQWRQPLTNLSLILQNLSYDSHAGLLDQPCIDQYLNRAQLAIDQMSTTIDDFREFFARSSTVGSFGLLAACKKCAALVSASMDANQIMLELSGDEMFVNGKESHFLQIMLNLLVNAKDAFLEHQVSPRHIQIHLETLGNTAQVSVLDNAGGIPPEILDRIFDPYFTTKANGTGIGLHMSRCMIVQHFQGLIEADNWHDGARFRLSMPLSPVIGQAVTDPPPPPAARENTHG